MSLGVTLVIVVVAVAAFLVAYKLKSPIPLPASKPSFCLLPKFAFTIHLPEELVGASDSVAELGRLLEPFGFAESAHTTGTVRYSRGSLLGDFSIRIAKVDLEFSLPLESKSHLRASYGSFAAFDTGDLWSFCSELRAKVAPAA